MLKVAKPSESWHKPVNWIKLSVKPSKSPSNRRVLHPSWLFLKEKASQVRFPDTRRFPARSTVNRKVLAEYCVRVRIRRFPSVSTVKISFKPVRFTGQADFLRTVNREDFLQTVKPSDFLTTQSSCSRSEFLIRRFPSEAYRKSSFSRKVLAKVSDFLTKLKFATLKSPLPNYYLWEKINRTNFLRKWQTLCIPYRVF